MASDDSELQGEDLIRFLNFTVFVSLKGLKTTLLKTSLFSCRYYEYTDWRPNDGKQYKCKPPPTASSKIFGLGRSLRYQGYWSVPSMVLPPAAGSQPGRFSKNLLLPHLNSCNDWSAKGTKYQTFVAKSTGCSHRRWCSHMLIPSWAATSQSASLKSRLAVKTGFLRWLCNTESATTPIILASTIWWISWVVIWGY